MEWISLKDKLPEDQEPVLLVGTMPPYSDNWMVIGYLFEPTNEFKKCSDDELISNTTHWMPLPEIPKK